MYRLADICFIDQDGFMDYLPHLSDPFRRDIAVGYLRHELRKFFPDLRDAKAWNLIDMDVSQWFAENPSLMPVRDFWNGVHAISMGFRLKNIVSWLTSAHIEWQERNVPVDELWFGSALGVVATIGQAPSAREVREWFFDPAHADIFVQARVDEEKYAMQTMPRDESPIFVMKKEGVLRVTDGNRRLLRALFLEQTSIKAVIGEPVAEPVFFESWVPTSILLDLVFFYHYWLGLGHDLTESIADIIAEHIRDSQAGRIEFAHRILSSSDPDQKLLENVNKRLGRDVRVF